MSDNWVVQNLQKSLSTWNDKLAEVWKLLTQSPEDFKGGAIWKVITDIHGALMAIGLALLVLFFVVGVVKTCGSFAEVKKPEHALKLFIRFAMAKGVVTYGLELMMALFEIVQGMASTIMKASGIGSFDKITLPKEMVSAIEDCGFFESIPLWAVTLIGSLFITVLSFIIIMSVYARFFKIYIYCHSTSTACGLCRAAHGADRKELHKVLCRSVSGRCDHTTGLYHLFGIRCITAYCGCRCSPGSDGVGICRRADLQYACAGRNCEDGRPDRKGNDGTLSQKGR